jgi:hypothetical protein
VSYSLTDLDFVRCWGYNNYHQVKTSSEDALQLPILTTDEEPAIVDTVNYGRRDLRGNIVQLHTSLRSTCLVTGNQILRYLSNSSQIQIKFFVGASYQGFQ